MKLRGLVLVLVLVSGAATGYSAEQNADTVKAAVKDAAGQIVAQAEDAASSMLSSKEGQIKTQATTAAKSAAESAKKKDAKPAFELPDEEKIDESLKPAVKTIAGTVSMRTRYGLGIEYAVDEKAGSAKEMWLNFTNKVKVVGLKSMDEFRADDRVKAVYQEAKDGSKRVLKEIALVKRKSDADIAREAREEQMRESQVTSDDSLSAEES